LLLPVGVRGRGGEGRGRTRIQRGPRISLDPRDYYPLIFKLQPSNRAEMTWTRFLD